MIATDTQALAGIDAALATGDMVTFAPAATPASDAEALAGIAAAVEAGEMIATRSSTPIAWALALAAALTVEADAEAAGDADLAGVARTNVRAKRQGLYVALRHDNTPDAAARTFAGVR